MFSSVQFSSVSLCIEIWTGDDLLGDEIDGLSRFFNLYNRVHPRESNRPINTDAGFFFTLAEVFVLCRRRGGREFHREASSPEKN